MHLKKTLILLPLFFQIVYRQQFDKGLDEQQQLVLKTAYEVGKTIVHSDNDHFAKTLASIALQESSAGKQIIGDQYEDYYYYIHYENGVRNEIKIGHWEIYEKNNKKYYLYKNKWQKRVYKKSGGLRSLKDSSLGAFQIKLTTAKRIIKENESLKKYLYLLNDDTKLVQKLLGDYKFSALLAGNYLRMNYEEAKSKKMWNPYFKSISRYNGGWRNTTYYRKIIKRMKFFESTNLFKKFQK